MRCPRHPERWSKEELDLNELNAILECPGCLEAFENQVLSEIESGEIPPVPAGFADSVLDRLDNLSLGNNPQNKKVKQLTFIHYVAAAVVTIAMVLSGGFNLVFHSAKDYSNAFNRYVNDVTAETTKVSIKNIRFSLDDLIKLRLNQKAK